MSPEPSVDLTETIARLQNLAGAEDTAAGSATHALGCLTEVARELIPMAAGAGITVVDEYGTATTTAPTDPIVSAADAAQYELGEGPCLRAWDTATTQYVADTTTDARWPRWSPTAAAAGIRSVLSAPLLSPGREIGALTVYATEPQAFTDYDEHLLGLLAGAGAPLVAATTTAAELGRLLATLIQSLESVARVEEAVGMLMERHDLHAPAARARLLATAEATRRSLARTAEDLLHDTGPPP